MLINGADTERVVLHHDPELRDPQLDHQLLLSGECSSDDASFVSPVSGRNWAETRARGAFRLRDELRRPTR